MIKDYLEISLPKTENDLYLRMFVVTVLSICFVCFLISIDPMGNIGIFIYVPYLFTASLWLYKSCNKVYNN